MAVMTAVTGLAALAAEPAEACVRAGEANTLVGWSEDGAYALYTEVVKGKIDHAEIIPTSYSGFLYTVSEEEGTIYVARAKVGSCANWADLDDAKAVVEKKKGTLDDKTLAELKTVKALEIGRAETPAGHKPVTVAFTGKKRYEVHDLEITSDAGKSVLPLPVFCVGSCLADENWKKWTVNVDGIHSLENGAVLYELSLPQVCNGGTIKRMVLASPTVTKAPKKRCRGSGE